MRASRITLALAAALLIGTVGAAPGAAASLGGFGARPAHFDPHVPATRAYFIRTVARGGHFSDEVVVFNNSTAPLPVLVYPVDGLTGATSGVVYGNRGNRLTGAGAWMHTARASVTLPAHTEVEIPFTVSVPRGAASGVHLAGVAIEERDPHASGGRFSVTEVLRAVVGVEVLVPGPTHAQLRLTAIRPVAAIGGALPGFVVSLINAGTGLCKPQVTLTLATAHAHATVTRVLDTLLPGDPIAYPFPWARALAAGAYTESVSATRCGRPVSLRAQATLGRSSRPAQPARVSSHVPAIVTTRTANVTTWWLIALVGGGWHRHRCPALQGAPPGPSRVLNH